MISFIDAHRATHGVEPICKVLPIAPSTYEFATLEWGDWFNNRQLLEPIGNISPAEAELRYYAVMEQPARAA